MKIRDITAAIEEFAPLGWQESFDNSGLIVGDGDAQVRSALICVDATEEVLDEAEAHGIGLVISHHPVIFNGLKRLTGGDQTQRVVERAVRAGIALYACHTNLDAVPGGLSWRLAGMLGLENVELLSGTRPGNPEVGFGVIGRLPGDGDPADFLRRVREVLKVKALRHSDLCGRNFRRVAINSGSGASLIDVAAERGADLYIAADFKYNNFLDARGRLVIADVGHFESEYCAIDLLYDIITKKFPNFALRKSEGSRNPVNYLV